MKLLINYWMVGAGMLVHATGLAQSAALVLEQRKEQTAPIPTGAIPPDNQWWKVFNDPLLDSLVVAGLVNNLDIKAIVSRVEEARTRIKVAESYQLPSVRLEPSASTQNLSPNRPVAIQVQDRQVTRFVLNTFQVPLNVSYEVDVWQRVRRQVQVNELLTQSTEAEQQAVRLMVASEIARTYWLLRTSDTEKRVLEQGLGLRDSTLAVVQARFKAGLTTQMDVQRAQTEVSNVRLQLQGVQRSCAELALSLAVLLGLSPQDFTVREDDLPASLPAIPAVPISQLPLHRPDLVQNERLVAAANAQVKISQTALKPRLNLVGSAGFASREAGTLFSANSATYLLGVGISVPIYEGFRNRNNIILARQQVQTASLTYQQRVLTASREVETALANLRILSEQVISQQEALASARSTGQYSRELYVKGLTTFLEVVDSERTALELERQAVNLKGQQALYTVALIKALGGSW